MGDLDPEEQMLLTMRGVMGAMMDSVKPVVRARIREVLERNETIVHQVPAALDFLTEELLAVLLPEMPDFTDL